MNYLNTILVGFGISLVFIGGSIYIFNKTEAFGATSPGTMVQLASTSSR